MPPISMIEERLWRIDLLDVCTVCLLCVYLYVCVVLLPVSAAVLFPSFLVTAHVIQKRGAHE